MNRNHLWIVVGLCGALLAAGCASVKRKHTSLATENRRTETTTSVEATVTGEELPEAGPSAGGVQKDGETVEVEETTRTRVIKRETVP